MDFAKLVKAQIDLHMRYQGVVPAMRNRYTFHPRYLAVQVLPPQEDDEAARVKVSIAESIQTSAWEEFNYIIEPSGFVRPEDLAHLTAQDPRASGHRAYMEPIQDWLESLSYAPPLL